jgi:putative endonuclease
MPHRNVGHFYFIPNTPVMFYTYILFSKAIDRFYIGISENPTERLKKHRAKNKGFTNQANDWEIVFQRSFENKSEALAFEQLIKSWKSKIKIIKLIRSSNDIEHPDA